MPKMPFEKWLELVDRYVKEETFLSYQDLPDCPYADWYQDGVTPKSAAKRAIKRASE
jgi:hypothetical protein